MGTSNWARKMASCHVTGQPGWASSVCGDYSFDSPALSLDNLMTSIQREDGYIDN